MLESMWRSKGVKQESEMLGRVGLSSLPVKPQEEMVLVTAPLSCPQPCREADHVSPGAEGLSSTWVSVAGAKTPLTQFKELKPQVWGRRQAGEAAAVPTPLQAGKERCLFLHHWTSLPPFGTWLWSAWGWLLHKNVGEHCRASGPRVSSYSENINCQNFSDSLGLNFSGDIKSCRALTRVQLYSDV